MVQSISSKVTILQQVVKFKTLLALCQSQLWFGHFSQSIVSLYVVYNVK